MASIPSGRSIALAALAATSPLACKSVQPRADATDSASALLEGGQSGSGGVFIVTEDNPWFYGSKPVTYCLKTSSSDFSASKEKASETVRDALDDWQKTVEILQGLKPLEESKRVATKFVEESCKPSTSLTFYLGVTDDVVKAKLESFPQFTIGASQQTRAATASQRTQGFIWLTADQGPSAYAPPPIKVSPFNRRFSTMAPPPKGFWSKEPTLFNVLLHEIGHVFGVTHQQGGVMDSIGATVAVHRPYDKAPGEFKPGSEQPDASLRFSSQYYLARGFHFYRLTYCSQNASQAVCVFSPKLLHFEYNFRGTVGFETEWQGPFKYLGSLKPVAGTYLAEANYHLEAPSEGFSFEHSAALYVAAAVINANGAGPGGEQGRFDILPGQGEIMLGINGNLERFPPTWSTRVVERGGKLFLLDPRLDEDVFGFFDGQ